MDDAVLLAADRDRALSFAECVETASIAGQLYGARHGLDALPAEAVSRIDVLEPLLEVWGSGGG